MTSETLTRGQIYDAASKVVQQALSQIEGVGQVQIGDRDLDYLGIQKCRVRLDEFFPSMNYLTPLARPLNYSAELGGWAVHVGNVG
jgi:multidrug efflux pump